MLYGSVALNTTNTLAQRDELSATLHMTDTTQLAADSVAKQPTINVFIALVMACLAIALTMRFAPAGDSVITVDATPNAKTTVTYVFEQRQWRSTCPAIAAEVESQIREGCASCPTTATCANAAGPQTTGTESYEEQRPSQTLYFVGGRATFFADTAAIAESACEASQNALKSTINGRSLCDSTTPAGTLSKSGLRGSPVTFFFGLLIVLLITVVVSTSHIQRRSMDELERLTTGHRQATSIATFLTDTQAFFLCWLSLGLGAGSDLGISAQTPFTNQLLVGWVVLISWLHFGVDHYRSRLTLHAELSHTFKAAIILGLAHTATAAIGGKISAAAPMLFWAMLPIFITTLRYVLRWILDRMDLWRRPALIIGRGGNSEAAGRALNDDFTLGYKTLRITNKPEIKEKYCELDNLAFDIQRASEVASKVKIVAALDSLHSPGAQKAITTLLGLNRQIEIVPSLRGLPALEAKVSHFFGHELIMLSVHNNLTRRSQRIFKRSFDVFVSLVLLTLLSPLLIYISLRIRSDGGTAFFLQERVGRQGKAFKCIKFRSMHIDAEAKLIRMLENPELRKEWQRNFKLANDPRVTPIGKVIRRYSLDELPQLINVLKGDMSLVGPRPLLFNELERYGETIDVYTLVAPGITGVWQVSGRSDTSFEQRREMDEWYIRNWNIYYDLLCLFRTVGVVAGSKGAY